MAENTSSGASGVGSRGVGVGSQGVGVGTQGVGVASQGVGVGSQGVGVGSQGVGVGVGSQGVGVGTAMNRMPWSYYATPVDLGFRAWALDFAPNNYGDDPFPKMVVADAFHRQWQTSDWDPSLRFWTLAFDVQLTEWLKDQDPLAHSIMAAREFAKAHEIWNADKALTNGWVDPKHLAWRKKLGTAAEETAGKAAIIDEIRAMFRMMEDDRDRWLAEIHNQADGLSGYFVALLGLDSERRPWTMELIRCGLAIGNVAYMHYKSYFKRVRPSTICAGLIPPFGPPRHPAFPSGHSFLGHFIALLLLEIDPVARAFGEESATPPVPLNTGVRYVAGTKPVIAAVKSKLTFGGPLLWLADRLAKNRERLGVHYPSDSAASRWLAGSIWHETVTTRNIDCPSLHKVLGMAKAEWA